MFRIALSILPRRIIEIELRKLDQETYFFSGVHASSVVRFQVVKLRLVKRKIHEKQFDDQFTLSKAFASQCDINYANLR